MGITIDYLCLIYCTVMEFSSNNIILRYVNDIIQLHSYKSPLLANVAINDCLTCKDTDSVLSIQCGWGRHKRKHHNERASSRMR